MAKEGGEWDGVEALCARHGNNGVGGVVEGTKKFNEAPKDAVLKPDEGIIVRLANYFRGKKAEAKGDEERKVSSREAEEALNAHNHLG